MEGVSTDSGPPVFWLWVLDKGTFWCLGEFFNFVKDCQFYATNCQKKKQPRLMKGREFSFWAENGAGVKCTTSECGTSQFGSFQVKTDRIIL